MNKLACAIIVLGSFALNAMENVERQNKLAEITRIEKKIQQLTSGHTIEEFIDDGIIPTHYSDLVAQPKFEPKKLDELLALFNRRAQLKYKIENNGNQDIYFDHVFNKKSRELSGRLCCTIL